MADISRIVIKSSSGYCCYDEAYNDKIIITEDAVSYEYIPAVESETNPKRKWKYKTNSPLFRKRFEEIQAMIPGILEKENDLICTDVGGIEFIITYSDKTKVKEMYWVPIDYFSDLFAVIKEIVPETEYIPAVLLTSDDYDEEE